MNKDRKKTILSAVLFFAVLALTFWYVLRDENLSQVVDSLQDARLVWVIPAVVSVVAFILGESVIIYYLLRKLATKPNFAHCCLYSFVGFFYSAVTPSASGGQPMQVVCMRRDGISGAVSTVVLAIVTVTYKLVLVLMGVAVLVFRPEGIVRYLDGVEGWMYLGLVLNVAFIILLLMAVFHPGTVRGGANLISRLLGRFRNSEGLMQKFENTINQYSGTAAFFQNNPRLIVHVFLITLLQRMFLFSVVWYTYLAFGLSGESFFVTVMLYAMISVAADMLPLPGGMGISETLFLAIFEPIFGEALVLPGMLVCRGISYYTQLLISAVMTAFAHLIFFGRRRKRK